MKCDKQKLYMATLRSLSLESKLVTMCRVCKPQVAAAFAALYRRHDTERAETVLRSPSH